MSSLRNKEKVVEKLYCNVCRKSFSSQKTLDQHLKSKLHEKKMAEAQEKQEKAKQEELEKEASQPVVELREENDTDKDNDNDKEENKTGNGEFTPEEYEFVPEKCLFCRQISDTMEESVCFLSMTHSNITHMFQKHGLIIPDRHCVIDMEGLLDYLGQKVAFSLCLSTVDLCGLHLSDVQPRLQKPHRSSGTYVGQRPHFHRIQHRRIRPLLAL